MRIFKFPGWTNMWLSNSKLLDVFVQVVELFTREAVSTSYCSMWRIFLLMTNCCSIEEKIYQRQMLKGEIAATVEDNVENRMKCKGGRYFSREELRELFALNMVRLRGNKTFLFCWLAFVDFRYQFWCVECIGQETLCETHDLLCGRGLPVEEQWRDCSEQVEDPALRKAIQTGLVSFVQEKIHLHQQDS